jgi:glycosyltransferase involved in cell wall biosynthesis
MTRILHLTTHLNIGGITSYIKLLTKEMKRFPYEFYTASSGGTQEQSLQAEGVKCLTLNIRTKSELSPKLYLAILPLINFIRKEKIDLLHAHTRVTQVLAWWVKRLTGIPYVSTCHGFYKRRLGRQLLPAWGDHAIAISVPVGQSLTRDFHVKSENVTTIFNAIDIAELERKCAEKNPIEIRNNYKIALTDPVIGIVARVVADKGHEFFLKAGAKLISGQFKNLKLLIVGDGPHLSNMRNLAKQLKIENSTLFLGNMQDVTHALSIIDVFVLPAIWREGFGLSIVEAMAVSKPVIVTNIWALNELVQDGVNGLLVNPKDVDGLANAIAKLLTDQKLYDTVAKNGREMVEREFSITQMAGRMDQLYAQILSRYSGRTNT